MDAARTPSFRAGLLALSLSLAACGGSGNADPVDGPGDPSSPPADGSPPPGNATPIGETRSGSATWYHADGRGACSYDASPEDLMVAAMNAPQYRNSTVCGMCVDVRGPRGQVRVRIVDLCPECPENHLDLSREAFARIADPVQGHVPITWTPVACEVQGPLAIRFKEGSSQWWLAVQVRNSRLPVERVELEKDGRFVPMARQNYNYSIDEQNPGPGPYSFRITASDGQQLIERNIPFGEGQVMTGTQQFAPPGD